MNLTSIISSALGRVVAPPPSPSPDPEWHLDRLALRQALGKTRLRIVSRETSELPR